jgi:site-specific DNA recombinase
MNSVAELIEQTISENARIAQNQEEYQKRYDSLARRFDRTKERLEKVEQSIADKQAHKEMVEQFITELSKHDAVTEFSEDLWYSLIDFVTVHTKDDIRVTFKNGTEIRL